MASGGKETTRVLSVTVNSTGGLTQNIQRLDGEFNTLVNDLQTIENDVEIVGKKLQREETFYDDDVNEQIRDLRSKLNQEKINNHRQKYEIEFLQKRLSVHRLKEKELKTYLERAREIIAERKATISDLKEKHMKIIDEHGKMIKQLKAGEKKLNDEMKQQHVEMKNMQTQFNTAMEAKQNQFNAVLEKNQNQFNAAMEAKQIQFNDDMQANAEQQKIKEQEIARKHQKDMDDIKAMFKQITLNQEKEDQAPKAHGVEHNPKPINAPQNPHNCLRGTLNIPKKDGAVPGRRPPNIRSKPTNAVPPKLPPINKK